MAICACSISIRIFCLANAAHSGATCSGFDLIEQDDGSFVAFLISTAGGCSASTTDESSVQYAAQDGMPCTDANDYAENIGHLKVSDKFLLPVEYIWTPEEFASIEVLNANGADLNVKDGDIDTGLSGHRIMVIDCLGTCGISGPSSAIEMLYHDTLTEEVPVSAYNSFVPMNQFKDEAADIVPSATVSGDARNITAAVWGAAGDALSGRCGGRDMYNGGLPVPVTTTVNNAPLPLPPESVDATL